MLRIMPHAFIQRISAALESSLGDTTVHAPLAKGTSAIAAAGVGLSLNDAATIAALTYSSLLTLEWLWKKLLAAPYKRWRKRRGKAGMAQEAEAAFIRWAQQEQAQEQAQEEKRP